MSKSNLVTLLTLFAGLLFFSGCKDDSIAPGPFQYPLDLKLSTEGHGIRLEWTSATVSTFTEYIIIRSLDSIPDHAEPELDGSSVIVERIDQIADTVYLDYEYPVTPTHYFKVYAKIGERFLMTPTKRIDVDLQLIPFRTDALAVDYEANEIVAYDRGLRILFSYNYETEKVLNQASSNYNNPIVRIGEYNGQKEVYLCDRQSVIEVRNRSNLAGIANVWLTSSSLQDFVYDQGRFVATFNSGTSSNVQLYSRSSLGQVSSTNGFSNSFRFLMNGTNVSDHHVYEFAGGAFSKFKVAGNVITTIDVNTQAASGIITPSKHPERDEFITTSSGKIIDQDLEEIGFLDVGNTFYNVVCFSGDGNYVAATRFLINTPIIEIFDANDGYSKVQSIPINFSPNFMFGDGEYFYATGLVFFNGSTQTAIIKIKIPS